MLLCCTCTDSPIELVKAVKFSLSETATPEDIAQLQAEYTQYFSEEGTSVNSLPDQIPLDSHEFDVENTDLGMEIEAKMSPDTLAQNIGLKGGLPLMFYPHRHKSGANVWDSPKLFDKKDSLLDSKLLWSQLSGLHSVLRNCFTSDPKVKDQSSMLIADEVGLGKTTLALSIIATLNQFIAQQKEGVSPPPILRKH
jgi:TATA-binding protein-associated factor